MLIEVPYSSCDIVYIIYAGCNYGSNFITYSLQTPIGVIIPEKTRQNHTNETWETESYDHFSNAPLNYDLGGIVHEFVHAGSGLILGNTVIGDYGYANQGQWVDLSAMYSRDVPGSTARHLDPWAKLQLGWLDYSILSAGVYDNYALPVVEKAYNGCAPRVAVIPIDVPWSPAQPDWTTGHYLIVENRRAYDLDHNLPTSGFLVWEYDHRLIDGGRGGLTLVEADGEYKVKFSPTAATSSSFFNEEQELSVWSKHVLGGMDGAAFRADPSTPQIEKRNRAITLKFGDYSTATDVNTIPMIAIDQPHTNSFNATQYNNQKKLVFTPNSCALVECSNMGASQTESQILLHVSTDFGNTWRDAYVMNDVALWSGTSFEPVATAAKAPAVASLHASDDNFFVVWQESVQGGLYRVKGAFPGQTPIDLATTPIACATGELLPAISYGFVDPVTGNTAAKIVFASDNGLMECLSTDNGATWSAPALIPGSTPAASHPSIGMSQDHEVLVFRDLDPATGLPDLFIRKDGGAVENLTNQWEALSAHHSPTISVSGDVAHIAWIASKVEPFMGTPIAHQKTATVSLDLSSSGISQVATFINRKYDRLEVNTSPAIAAVPTLGLEQAAAMIWTTTDENPGARMYMNVYRKNPLSGFYEWPPNGRESSLSTLTTMGPVIEAKDGNVRMVVTRGEESPYRLLGQLMADDLGPGTIRWEGERTVEYLYRDIPSGAFVGAVHAEQPRVVHMQGDPEVFDIAGPDPYGITSTYVHDHSMTTAVLLDRYSAITWDLRLMRTAANLNQDTVEVVAHLFDVLSSLEVGSSTVARIPAACLDTAFTLGLELPPSLYPSALVTVNLEVRQGVFDAPTSAMAILVNNYGVDDTVSKAAVRNQITATGVLSGGLSVSPQPVRTEAAITYDAEDAGGGRLRIFDYLGRCVHAADIVSLRPGPATYHLDTGALRAGSYLVILDHGNARSVGRLTVVK